MEMFTGEFTNWAILTCRIWYFS